MSVIHPVRSQSDSYSQELQAMCGVSQGLVDKINQEWVRQEEAISEMIKQVKSETPAPLKLSFFQKIFAFFSKDFKTKLLQAHNTAQAAQKKSRLDDLSAQQTAAENKMKAQMTQVNNAFSEVLKQFNRNQAESAEVAASLDQKRTELRSLQEEKFGLDKTIEALDAEDTARVELGLKESEARAMFEGEQARLTQAEAPVSKYREQRVKREAAQTALMELTKGRKIEIDTLIRTYRDELESDVQWGKETPEEYLARQQKVVAERLEETYTEKTNIEAKKPGRFSLESTRKAYHEEIKQVDGRINLYTDQQERLAALANQVASLSEKSPKELDLEKTIEENQENAFMFTYEYNLEKAQQAHAAASKALEAVAAQFATAEMRRETVVTERRMALEGQDAVANQLDAKHRDIKHLEKREAELSSVGTLEDLIKRALQSIAL